ITGDTSKNWVVLSDRIRVFSWLLLGVGIGLGSVWAYYELAFGGYWAWDPVENASLLPWLTCFDNVHLAVERVFGATESRDQLAQRTREALALVHLTHAEHKYPHEISGGMKQRVGIARALSMQPKVLLMDEPFGALDALTRAHLQDELMKIVATSHSTVVMVTHDVDEAVLLSDRIVMMTNGPAATIGEILSVDLPRPRNRLALANDAHYHSLRGAVLEFLYQKQAKKAA
ncbi:MAG: cytochrome c biogenesis protein CcsA, partial [Gallionellaceae bacterium]|nr:cytochrome c biogenesis protein CcsA [Gallionellaceae bacterium]